jgi:hypothetical protein
MFKRISFVLLTLAVLLTACGPQATPTMSAADVQGTAIAAAFTMLAATQQAIPTATPLPPTPVPSPTQLPTFTPVPLIPTLAFLPSPTTAAASGDPCAQVLDKGAAGPTKRVRIENTTDGTAKLSLTLTSPNPFGQCGYLIGFNNVFKKGSKWDILELPTGNWTAWAFIEGGSRPSTAVGSFYLGPSKATELLRLVIRPDVIGIIGP